MKDKHTFAKKLPEMVVKLSFMSQFYIETEYIQILKFECSALSPNAGLGWHPKSDHLENMGVIICITW